MSKRKKDVLEEDLLLQNLVRNVLEVHLFHSSGASLFFLVLIRSMQLKRIIA